MKKFIPAFVILALVQLFPPAAGASCRIILENGGRFTTPLCWEDGGNIMFYVPGGSMGVEKKSVRKIEKLPDRQEPDADIAAPERIPAETATKMPAVESKPPALPSAEKNIREDNRFMREFNGIKERFRTANTMTATELSAFEKELTAFRNKILAERLGHIYSDKLIEIADMGGEVEDLLKAKGY
jgi:hypothetical protein